MFHVKHLLFLILWYNIHSKTCKTSLMASPFMLSHSCVVVSLRKNALASKHFYSRYNIHSKVLDAGLMDLLSYIIGIKV